MSNKSVEIKVSEEVYALIKKAAEQGRRKGRGEPVPCTIGEMAADYVQTGVYRRIAANKWAKKHPTPAKPKKVKPAKVIKLKKAKPAKAAGKPSKSKAKKAGGKKTGPAPKSAAAPAATSMLE